MRQIPDDTVDAREGLAVGEYGIVVLADIAELEAEMARLREALKLADKALRDPWWENTERARAAIEEVLK